jgi:putative FmdB family regulatory protein
MPIYEYQCEKCDCSFELLTVSSKEKNVSCPKCGTDQVKRLLSTACFGGSSFNNCGPGGSGGFS